MAQLRLTLLGAPAVVVDEQPVYVESRKALALLFYLAVTQERHSRDTLATLLWPEQDQTRARASVRQALWLLRQAGLESWLTSDQDALALQPGYWCDLHQFRAHLAAERLHEALALYQGDLLAGFSLRDCPEFDQWHFLQADILRQQVASALERQVHAFTAQGDYTRALDAARGWLALDLLHEPAHRHVMQLYAYGGQHAAALRQFDECVRLLREELDVTPDIETVELYQAIKARQLTPPAIQSNAAPPAGLQATAAPAPASSLAALPTQPTAFFGRAQEVAEVERLLAQTDVRLITISGPGGIGKTRLALEVARRSQSQFAAGVVFVPLQSTPSAEFLATAIAEALHLPMHSHGGPREQLLHALAGKALLLVLDNFEHLLAAAPLLGEMLAASPLLKLLVTSRETLNLQEEWLFALEGLTVPDAAHAAAIVDSEAGQFFIERARRVRRDFALADEAPHVARICQLVAGMPLALELAAVWTKTLTCAAIAARITHELAFLETNLRNIDARHRSMRATLDHSWVLLNAFEQTIFMRLSVFRGGFVAEAAKAVAGATLPVLAALVDKSLLWRRGDGRYEMHELLRQYGNHHLDENAQEVAATPARHCEYYVRFLGTRMAAIQGAHQLATFTEITAELENIRVAWQHPGIFADFETLLPAMLTLNSYYFYRGPYQESWAAMQRVLTELQARQREDASPELAYVIASALNGLGWAGIRLGRFEEAAAVLEESRLLYARLERPLPHLLGSDPLAALANLALIHGNYGEATRLAISALHRSQVEECSPNEALALYCLANATKAEGNFDAASDFARRAVGVAQANQDRWFLAYCMIELGDIATALGAYAEAEQHFQTAYTLRKEFDDPQGMALALGSLGHLANSQASHAEAKALYARGVAIYREIGDRGGLATVLAGSGAAACALGDLTAAKPQLTEALQIANTMGYIRLILTILTDIGVLLLQIGQGEAAHELLGFVADHAAGDQATRTRARLLLGAQPASTPRPTAGSASIVADARTATSPANVQAVAARVLLHMSALPTVLEATEPDTSEPDTSEPDPVLAAAARMSVANEALVEPLNAREVEILALVADGLSNQEIADRLFLSIGTVKWYTGQIYGKLDVKTRTQAVARARTLHVLT